MKILDSSVIIAFYSELKQPDLLHEWTKLGHDLYIPDGVKNEIVEKSTKKILKTNIDKGLIIELTNIKKKSLEEFKNRYPFLGAGEIEVLIWARTYKERNICSYCILDDKKARNVAERLDLNFTGCIGLIQKLVDKNVISSDEKKSLYKKLRSSGFRISNIDQLQERNK